MRRSKETVAALTEAAAVVVINRHRAVIVRQNPVVGYRIVLLHHRSGAIRCDGPVAIVHVDHAVPGIEGAMLFHSTVLAGLARLRGRTSNREPNHSYVAALAAEIEQHVAGDHRAAAEAVVNCATAALSLERRHKGSGCTNS